MKAVLTEDHQQDHAVSREGDGVQEAKRDGDPHLGRFQARDTRQKEGHRLSVSIIENHHHGGLKRKGYLDN